MGVSMAQNWLRITHQNDKIQLSWQRGLSAPRSAPPVTFEHPFDEETLTDLRWYLEKFLPFPYGIFPDKAKKIEQKFQEWGQRLFELVFPRSTKAWDFFCEATREGLDKCEINISSDDPTVLNLPWELVYSPDYQFLAPSLAGMYRSLSGHPVRAEMGQLPQDKLNILLVIARPYGEKDVALKTIARPLLEALKPIQKYVNLKVLRPPSFEEFERELNAHKGFYHIVHFDGHGNFDPDSTGFQYSFGSKGQGVLVFENIDGSPQIITATQIAQSLNDCRVPIFVLNACKSAQEGDGSFSSVATRLVSLGAKGVVAMAYNVQVEAAKHFIGRFYQQLVLGTDVSTAVAAARRQVLNQRLRPSPKGDLPLADWMVPVLYQQESYMPFVPTSNSAEDILDIDNFLEEPVSNLVGFPEQGRYGFIGRDYDILGLERAFRQNNVVLLQGMGGVGKTELTAGFARWLEETQGREKIFFTSFEHGASLSRIVNEVGRAVWGDKFSQYAAEQQRQAVLKYLQSQPCLLIWDNFEPVAGFPEGNEPLLSADERDDLKHFLKELRGGKTWVLITSRREETWLDCGYSLINLQGLSPVDAQEFAAKILRSQGVEIKNLPEEYLDLLKLLGGHPLSLRVVLPHLRSQTPTQVIEALHQGLDSLEKKTEIGRDKSLTASLDYSFSKLSEKTRRHLPFLGLFSEQVDAHRIHYFTGHPDNQILVQIYKRVFSESLQKADWLEILNEAAETGILEYLNVTVYKIHPVLPWYLRQRLSQHHEVQQISELETMLLVFYTQLAQDYGSHLRSQNQDDRHLGRIILDIEEPNLLKNLRFAEQQNKWLQAKEILTFLEVWYKQFGRAFEFELLRQQALMKIGNNLTQVKVKGENAFDFWIFLQLASSGNSGEIDHSVDLEELTGIYQEILDELTTVNNSSMNHYIALICHKLGLIAQELRQYEQARDYYLKALKIKEEEKDDIYNVYVSYLQLGNLAFLQEQNEQARDYYLKALKIEELGDLHAAGHVYHQLGNLAYVQYQYEQALTYYSKVLEIRLDMGDWHNVAKVYLEKMFYQDLF
jgi:tetratricopeptide (TPR) repeat protein